MTGHGDLVEDSRGRWWMVFLGTRIYEYQHQHLGRETFLAPVRWNEDGWPVVGDCGTIDTCMTANLPEVRPVAVEPERDDFDAGQLRFCWNWLRNPVPENYDLHRPAGASAIAGDRRVAG